MSSQPDRINATPRQISAEDFVDGVVAFADYRNESVMKDLR